MNDTGAPGEARWSPEMRERFKQWQSQASPP